MSTNDFCNDRCCGCDCGCSVSCCSEIGKTGATGATGPQGIQGARGATGATGQTGAQGMAATVSVESSASVPFDIEPTVVNVGTPQAAILRFSIPAGKPGLQGATGATGAAGATGATGEAGAAGAKGATGATGPSAIKAYGQLVSIISSADLFTDIPVQVPLPLGGEAEKVDLAPNTITIKESGCYILQYNMFPSLMLTVGYADLTLKLRANGVAIPYTSRTIRSTTGTHPLEFYGSTLAWLEKGDVIDAAFICNDDGKFFFGVDNISSFMLMKIA